eukprot:TRINITY_DN11070_c0_g1_i2.p1 TRINITY_DN11070_c0_g1~~TRINITY_DN11070_c0_g1_i2.p1  ORF type:complete len:308 (+),score=69.71 TRINITY_DN11070_c0_g1_i2:201-1124(+)
MGEAIGMMGGAFFVPKGELMSWINDLLKLNITRIEQLGTGAVYCQIFDAVYPGKVPMQKVNWKAKLEWEFIQNYKFLQQAFERCKIKKHIDVERLMRAKYQDNLEFAQWMKKFYDLNCNKERTYDSLARRGDTEPDFSFIDLRGPPRKNLMERGSQLAGDEISESMLLGAGERRSKSMKRDNFNNLSFKVDGVAKGAKARDAETLMYRNERDSLYQKLKKIESIIAKGRDDKDKLTKIQEVISDLDSIGGDLVNSKIQTTVIEETEPGIAKKEKDINNKENAIIASNQVLRKKRNGAIEGKSVQIQP